MRFDLTDLALFLRGAGRQHHARRRPRNLALAAASARIRNLEASLGAAAGTRSPRRHARRPARNWPRTRALMLAQAERLRDDLSGYAGEFGSSVRVLSNTNALTAFLPEALSGWPRIRASTSNCRRC